MSKLTAREVEALLLEHKDDETDDWADGFDWPDWAEVAGTEKSPETSEVVGLGEVKVWDHDFPHDTNTAWLMFQVGDRIFRKEGEWVSFAGMYWEGPFSEVRPTQKIVLDYEYVKG